MWSRGLPPVQIIMPIHSRLMTTTYIAAKFPVYLVCSQVDSFGLVALSHTKMNERKGKKPSRDPRHDKSETFPARWLKWRGEVLLRR